VSIEEHQPIRRIRRMPRPESPEPAPTDSRRGRRLRALGFAALCVACVSAATTYVAHTARRTSLRSEGTVHRDEALPSASDVGGGPHLVFRNMVIEGGQAGYVGVASLAADRSRSIADLKCHRVYFSAGNGLCLTVQGDLFTPYRAVFFGPDFQPRSEVPLQGLPSRARVSPDGRLGAATVFVSGDSYASNSFSTRTHIYDMATGESVGDLERFTVRRDGARIQSPDFNFWGVTFTRDPGRFYATLGTAGHTYLVRGDVASREVEVLRDGVECPSLSPDGRRIAFKKRFKSGGDVDWRPAVLDVDTLEEHLLAETRNVDDQMEWLDNDTVLYGVDSGTGPPSIWSVPSDGSGQPQLFVSGADSPAVVNR
jgi:WD40 repeat protein